MEVEMSDFLHDLRSGKFKRGDRNNWSQNDKQYRGSHRRSDTDGRRSHPHSSHKPDQISTAINEAVSEIKNILKDLAASHKRFADAYEFKAKSDERRAEAMESIADFLKQRFADGIGSAREDRGGLAPESAPNTLAMAAEQTTNVADPDYDQVRNDILDMRKKGLSYEKIAQHLESNGAPTFSGRGKWRAQMISKLCKEIHA